MHRPALRRVWLAVVGAALLGLFSAGLTPSAAADPTCIYLVQGLPGRTVSVTVDDEEVASSLAGGKVAGPFAVEDGTRTVTFRDGDDVLATGKVTLAAGSNSEVVLHLPASPTGDPVVTRFDNRLDAVQNNRAAHSVAHVGAAGPIDIRADEQVVSANVANGEFTYKVVPAGTRTVDVVMTGKSEPLLGPFENRLAPANMTWLFVVGVPGRDLAVIRHVIPLAESKDQGSKRPGEVATGTGGQAAELAAAGG